jgi:hypothetical protein
MLTDQYLVDMVFYVGMVICWALGFIAGLKR